MTASGHESRSARRLFCFDPQASCGGPSAESHTNERHQTVQSTCHRGDRHRQTRPENGRLADPRRELRGQFWRQAGHSRSVRCRQDRAAACPGAARPARRRRDPLAGPARPGRRVPAYRKQVIYLHQRPALLEGSVEHNLRYPFTLEAHQPRSFDRQRAIDLLVSLGRECHVSR